MDKNSIVGLALIFVILVGYSIFMRPSEEQRLQMQRTQDSIALVKTQSAQAARPSLPEASLTEQDEILALPDSLRQERLLGEFGSFAAAAEGEQRFITLRNNLLTLRISTRGGRPFSVQLQNYTRYNGSPLVLFDGDSTRMGFQFFAGNKTISTNDLYFKPVGESDQLTVTADSASYALRLYAGEESYIEYLYTLKADDYMVGFDVRFVNMERIIAGNTTSIELDWSAFIPGQEKGSDSENSHSAILYRYSQDDVEEFSATKDEERENIKNRLQWIAFKQQFFSSVLINHNAFSAADISSRKLTADPKYLKQYSALATLDYDSRSKIQSYPLSFYFGPNQFNLLNKYNMELGRLVELGGTMSRFINRYIILTTFNFLNRFISNYGIIILILTLLIKIALYPLTKKSFYSMAKMRVLKPQIDEITKKYPADKAMEKQQATAALYKKAGVNPLGGCLPMLLQFPILIAMFRFFPSSIELRQEAFLWADDLSTYDSILNLPFEIPFYGDHVSLFTLLMTLTTILSTKLTPTTTDSSMPGMKSMMYLMPVMFMFMFNSFPAALTYYYLLTNIITIGQNEIMRRMIDEKALLQQMNSQKAKPTQKSKFQQRLEKMAKEKGYKMS
ncbi:MAG: membrane protein insertase YidC [Bacteroidales bacterium]